MFPDNINNPLIESVFFRKFYAIRHVLQDNLGTALRGELIVWRVRVILDILRKISGSINLTDIVIKCTNPGSQRICTNGIGSSLGQTLHRLAVLEGTTCLLIQPAKEG